MSVVSLSLAPPAQLSKRRAEELTAKIRGLLAEALDLIADAWAGRAWEALEYPTWEAYLAAELPEVKLLKLPIDARRDAVAAWSRRGMPQSAMASGLNVSAGTVNADVSKVGPTPEEGAVVVSFDGKRRAARALRVVEPEPSPAPRPTRTVEALALVRATGDRGLTSVELSRTTGWPEGLPSGTLCRLERRGLVRRVQVFRERRAAYVAI